MATLELITPIIAGESGRVQTRLLADVFTYLAERDQTIPAKKIENAANELTAES